MPPFCFCYLSDIVSSFEAILSKHLKLRIDTVLSACLTFICNAVTELTCVKPHGYNALSTFTKLHIFEYIYI